MHPHIPSPPIFKEPHEIIQIPDSLIPSLDTYNPLDSYEQLFVEHPPPIQPSISPCPQQNVPAQVSIQSE